MQGAIRRQLQVEQRIGGEGGQIGSEKQPLGIVAQRLVRKLCPHCKTSGTADPIERRLLGLTDSDPDVSICRAGACEHCKHQGYKGRMAIMEILKVTPEIDEAIARRASLRELRAAAREAGFRSLVDDGMRRVLEGTTSLEEVARVVDLTVRTVKSLGAGGPAPKFGSSR